MNKRFIISRIGEKLLNKKWVENTPNQLARMPIGWYGLCKEHQTRKKIKILHHVFFVNEKYQTMTLNLL
jgi:hypothetical protein